jgi:DNA-binding NarL/FixJ family response regulator
MTMVSNVLLCDTTDEVASLQYHLLREAPDLLVEVTTDAFRAVESAARVRPDVVVCDLELDGLGGPELVRRLVTSSPGSRVIARSASPDPGRIAEALAAGASGYLLKEVPIEEVAKAIRSVWGGQSRLSPSIAAKLLAEFAAMSKRAEEHRDLEAPRLTGREMDVLRLVAKGLRNRDIAQELFIAENTVKNHVRSILEKLNIHSRTEAVVYAVREKLLEIE